MQFYRLQLIAPQRDIAVSLITYSFMHGLFNDVGLDSSVGIGTRYGLDGPGIESRWRRDFPHPSTTALGLTQPPIQ
jgi:hypothetical protein